jgi:hypothetical protein
VLSKDKAEILILLAKARPICVDICGLEASFLGEFDLISKGELISS